MIERMGCYLEDLLLGGFDGDLHGGLNAKRGYASDPTAL